MKQFKFTDENGNAVTLTQKEQMVAKQFSDKFNEAIMLNDTSNIGAQIDITTLTTVLKTVSQQKFYTIPVERYINVDIDGGWADQTLQVREYLLSKPMSGFLDQAAHGSKMAVTEAAVDGIYLKALTWAKKIEFSIAEVNQAAMLGNFNLVSAKERARKKSHDLDMQQLAFLGYNNEVKGILNQSDVVTVDTTLLDNTKLSDMDFNGINKFVAKIVEAYRANSNRTAYPNVFMIPESDYNGLASQVSPEFPVKNKLALLKEAFDLICMRPVEILPCAYGDKANNDLNVTRYALYNKEFDTIRLQKAIDYTPTMINNIDGWNFTNVAFARTFGVLINRPQEVLYLDITA